MNGITGSKKPAAVFVVDDHPLLRRGLAELINNEEGMMVCGEADAASEALAAIGSVQCDIAIVDICLKDDNGLELVKKIKASYPSLFVLVVSMHDESVFAQRALDAGADGFLSKLENCETVVAAMRKILGGEVFLSQTVGKKVLDQFRGKSALKGTPLETLSDRELQVFGLMGQGLITRLIAEKLLISIKTVETHQAHIRDKLELRNANELVYHAIQWAHSGVSLNSQLGKQNGRLSQPMKKCSAL